MRRKAEANNTAPQVRFQFGFAHQTGLPGGSADIVTCSQALHWMEPESTFTEVARILRPGGVFAAYDYDWPPTVHWEAERAFLTFMERIRELRNTYTITSDMQQWAKHEHLARMRASQRFRYVKEILLHNTEPCTAERWAGFALTLGHVVPVLTLGLSDTELGLDEFRHVAQQTLGNKGLP
jgi:ubiquinone/menaquinone biosynthesis C-methylase UbiE